MEAAAAVSPSTVFYVEVASAGSGGAGSPPPPGVEALEAEGLSKRWRVCLL